MATTPDPAEWDALAAHWIQRCRSGEPNRAGLLDGAMLTQLGDVTGLRVIDLGCGEGRFCRMLAARGAAEVLGVDLCAPLIAAAETAKSTPVEAYGRLDMQTLTGIPDRRFDLAVSYVSLVDVPDLAAAVQAAWRVLKPGGRFLICNLAPMATAVNKRITEPDGRRVAIRVDHYFDESTRVMNFSGHTLTNYHRTLTTSVNTFLQAGFRLTALHEPRPTDADLAQYPELANERFAPSFILYDLRKKAE